MNTIKRNELKYIIAKASGIPSLINRFNRNRPLVLAYHGIYDGPKRLSAVPDTFVHVRDFVDQLQFIKKHYRLIDPEEFLIRLQSRSSFPPDSALITFDDGYESFYRLAEPVLRDLEIHAIVFIATEYVEDQKPFWFDVAWLFLKNARAEKVRSFADTLGIDSNAHADAAMLADLCLQKMKQLPSEPRDVIVVEMTSVISEPSSLKPMLRLLYPMTSAQLQNLAARGTIFGGHTHTHTILSALHPSLAEREVLENRQRLESLLEKPCHFFAYPNGDKGDFNHEHKKILKNAGYKAAFSLTQKRSSLNTDPMNISRINVAPEDTLRSLAFRCTGIDPIVSQLRNYMASMRIHHKES